jgi:hypothetical protein
MASSTRRERAGARLADIVDIRKTVSYRCYSLFIVSTVWAFGHDEFLLGILQIVSCPVESVR